VINDPHADGRFLSLVPSSEASARSSLDGAAPSGWHEYVAEDAQSDADGGERSVRPSTAKRQLDQILKSKLHVHNIHVSAEASEAGWGGASARSNGSTFSQSGPGNAASVAKSRLQNLLDGAADDEAAAAAGGVSGAEDDAEDGFGALKDKVQAYKARKALARGGVGQKEASDASVDQSVASADSTDQGVEKAESEYGKTIDSCLSVRLGPNKPPEYLEDLWVRAATIAMEHVPQRKTEVVTEVTDRLIKLGREGRAAELCLSAGFHKVRALDDLKSAALVSVWCTRGYTMALKHNWLLQQLVDASTGCCNNWLLQQLHAVTTLPLPSLPC
jgi:hypothetical protein